MTLLDAMPYEYKEDTESKAHKFDAVEVIWEQDVMSFTLEPWIGKHKYVFFWVKLVNGYAVGWNENPSIGWSFPMVKIK